LHEAKASGLQISYSAHALRLSVGHQNATVGVATFGRGANVRAIGDKVDSTSTGATYVAPGATERLVRTSAGLEQSFLITSRPNGAGNLRIAIPLGDVAASGRGSSLTLTGVGGREVGSYSGLVVRDASGHRVPSMMSYSSVTHQVIINVTDAHATYPLRVDPTWSLLGSGAFDPGATSNDIFGYAVAISGSNAVVGANTANQGAVYFYSLIAGVWTLNTASGTGGEITDPGATNFDEFGETVAISGTNAVVGAYGANNYRGAIYFYSLSAGVWTLNTLSGTSGTIADPAATFNDQFGRAVALSGTNAVVGAFGTNTRGAVYFYSLSAGVWTLNTLSGTSGTITDPAAAIGDDFGYAVAIDGANAVVGGYKLHNNEGAIYFYSLSAGVWTLNTLSGTGGEIIDPAATNSDEFGEAVAISGTNAIVGSDGVNGYAGAIYFYSLSAGVWTLNAASGTSGEITDPGATSNDEFGAAVAISGTNAVVGAYGANGAYSSQGAVYFYSLNGGVWTLNTASGTSGTIADPAASINDQFGTGVAIDGTNAAAGAPGVNLNAGATYFYNTTTVSPAPVVQIYTVSFNAEGGSAVPPITAVGFTNVTLPGAPTYAGHTFEGWFVEPAGGGAAVTYPYFPMSSTTLYAQWIPNATDTVSFNTEGGGAVSSLSGLDGTVVSLPNAPTYAGYTFDGWFTAPSGGTALTSPYTLAGSVTLYAQWTPVPVTTPVTTPVVTTSYQEIGIIQSFALGSAALTSALKNQIADLVHAIEVKHLTEVKLVGNATLPSSSRNALLAKNRASVVEAYMAQLGLKVALEIKFTQSGTATLDLDVRVFAK